MKKLIQSERAHSIPPYYRATTFTVKVNLDMVPGAMHTVEDAAKAILNTCNYLLAAVVDTAVKPGSKGVEIQILGAMDSVRGTCHQPEDHVSFINAGGYQHYIKDVTFDPEFAHAYVMRGRFNEMADQGDLFSTDEITG
ncbi:hypothetical protein [Sulfitobacter sp. R18_1]|uniref:hypothetical protein n=1 Tax=Sulfitobacter sp. R18_1 TaxID=2821104 RepID=UPI001ADC040D|nr:hypothetical protein [Sulfitobacter sp. R18_1]MBO9427954.1 hypothetical protein [Sulfitobacter sp. R18_1]